MTLDDKINYSIELLRKSEKMALKMDPENGFYLAFSGGKDSQALYHIAQMAGVKFKAHMNLTSVDPPEVIRFVKKNYPNVELIKPKMSIYDMALKKHMLPTRILRWCCAEFKEMSGGGEGHTYRHPKSGISPPFKTEGGFHSDKGHTHRGNIRPVE